VGFRRHGQENLTSRGESARERLTEAAVWTSTPQRVELHTKRPLRADFRDFQKENPKYQESIKILNTAKISKYDQLFW
jgi:hypothetical protein